MEAVRREIAVVRTEFDEGLKKAHVRIREADDRASEVDVAVARRLRFFYNYRRLTGSETSRGATVVRSGNMAAHIRDSLHGMAYENAEPYTKSKTMVAIINQRATMLANLGRSPEKWEKNRQSQIERRISDFTNPSSEQGEQCQEI
ncbi:hypothetical protein HOY82DRAFT_595516 [Tuber indicum]|nr:hypothetical protein HOY82DRAFT_595516 [Tuber indicum]